MEEKYIVAVEIGSSKIKGALAAIEPSGIVNVVAMREEPLVDCVRYGQIKNVEEVSKRIDAIKLSLENSRQITPRKVIKTYVGLSGLSVGSRVTEVSKTFPAETEISDATISSLKDKAATAAQSDRDLYAVIPIGYIVDNIATTKPVGTFATSIKARFLIISGAPGIRSNINRVLPERLKLDIAGYIVSPLAQADAVLTENDRRLGVVFVDFGAETTTVAIYKNGAMQYLATLPMGSRNITRDLMSLSHLEERAEDIKRANGVTPLDEASPRPVTTDALDQPEINSCIYARSAEIIANILAQIEYAGMVVSDLPAGIVITGGGMKMKGFCELLSSRAKMHVRPATAPRGVRISDPTIHADDAIDIIALLLNGATGDTVECISPMQRQVQQPVVEQPVQETPRAERPNTRQDLRGMYDDDSVRIGMDENDILEDDPDDKWHRRNATVNDDDHRAEGRIREKHIPRKPKKSTWDKLMSRVNRLISDENDDTFDNDEE